MEFDRTARWIVIAKRVAARLHRATWMVALAVLLQLVAWASILPTYLGAGPINGQIVLGMALSALRILPTLSVMLVLALAVETTARLCKATEFKPRRPSLIAAITAAIAGLYLIAGLVALTIGIKQTMVGASMTFGQALMSPYIAVLALRLISESLAAFAAAALVEFLIRLWRSNTLGAKPA
jgi:hypothetical protein